MTIQNQGPEEQPAELEEILWEEEPEVLEEPEEPEAPSNPQDTEAVEAALYRRALGMTLREVRREETDKGTKTIITEKEVAPDYTAQIFILKNRRPDRWRDKPPEVSEDEPENNLLEILQAVGETLECAGDSPADGSAEVGAGDGDTAGDTAGENPGERSEHHAL